MSTINLSDISQFTFDPPPPHTFVAQDMTQSWPSQQALGGDQAQQILYNSKVCLCVVYVFVWYLIFTLPHATELTYYSKSI